MNNKIRILYDHQVFCLQKFGGISRCFIELLKHMPDHILTELSLAESDNEYALEYGVPNLGSAYRQFLSSKDFFGKKLLFDSFHNIKFNRLRRWQRNPDINLYHTIERIRRGDYDIFHPTYFLDYYLDYVPKNKHIVITIHDLIPEHYNDMFANDIQLKNRRRLIDSASHIVAVSQNTKDDIIRLYNVPENKISVVYHGADEQPYHPRHNVMNGVPYMLYVGARWSYKNFIPFCKATIPALRKYPDMHIVITGNDLDKKEKSMLADLGILDRIVHKYCVSTQEILDLYHFAVCFVYPSAYEGFGIPILEAYKSDCPVMLNNASCFPEIATDAAVYFKFEENGDSDFSEKFIELYDNNSLRQSLLHKQRLRLKDFSWKQSAISLSNVYREIMER